MTAARTRNGTRVGEAERGTRNWQARENLEKVSTCLVRGAEVPAAVHRLAAAADVSLWTKKDRTEKGTREAAYRRTKRGDWRRIMNTYACTYRGGTSFTASGRSGREGGRERFESDGAPKSSRCSCRVAEIIVRSSSAVSTPFFAGDGCTLLNLVLCTVVPSRASTCVTLLLFKYLKTI